MYRKEDAGLLVYKDHLPVSQVVVGDTSRAGSEAKLTVGSLRCQGDCKCCVFINISSMLHQALTYMMKKTFLLCEGNYWNAASFTSPASSLHLPSFRGETSTDISFYFKTSSTNGMLVENLGTSDFLRIELRGMTC